MKSPLFLIFTLRLAFFALLATLSLARSETPPQLPTGRLLKAAPQNSCWEIKYDYGKDVRPKGSPPEIQPLQAGSPSEKSVSRDHRPLSVKVTKAPGVLYEETQALSGETWRRWHFGKSHLEILELGRNGRVQAVSSLDSKNELVSTYEKEDFPDFRWISASTFSGIQKVGSVDCLLFSGEVALAPRRLPIMEPDEVLPPETSSLTKVKTLAWIDAETRLPVRWQRESEIRTFQFGSASPLPVLPPEGKRLFKLNTTPPPTPLDVRQ